MKARPQEIARHLKALDPKFYAVLIFGPDNGLVDERAKRIAGQILKGRDDPFLSARFSSDQLKADPSRLFDEVLQPPLTGEQRFIRVDQAQDVLTPTIQNILEEPHRPANFLLLLAENLPASSKLRQLMESADNALAIPCYADSAENIDALIDQILISAGYDMTADARHYLVRNLGSDRALSRAELEKLALFMGIEKHITLSDVENLIGDTAGLALERVAEAALGGAASDCDRHFRRAMESGATPIAVIRVLLQRIEKLYRASLERDNGRSIKDAIGNLRPPVFWKDRTQYEAQLQRWNTPMLSRALDLALEAELECKSSHIPAEEACERALLRLAMAAARQA